nr:hypothetical protein [Tanacetum cinerariifolium]
SKTRNILGNLRHIILLRVRNPILNDGCTRSRRLVLFRLSWTELDIKSKVPPQLESSNHRVDADSLAPTAETLIAALTESFVLSAGVDETKAILEDYVPREDECLTSDS